MFLRICSVYFGHFLYICGKNTILSRIYKAKSFITAVLYLHLRTSFVFIGCSLSNNGAAVQDEVIRTTFRCSNKGLFTQPKNVEYRGQCWDRIYVQGRNKALGQVIIGRCKKLTFHFLYYHRFFLKIVIFISFTGRKNLFNDPPPFFSWRSQWRLPFEIFFFYIFPSLYID